MRTKRRIRKFFLASRTRSNAGFTLIELLVIIVVLFLLFQLVTQWAIPTFQYYWNGQDQQHQHRDF